MNIYASVLFQQASAADLSDLLIVFIKRFPIFSVEESGNAHNFFFLVDDGQRQNIFDNKPGLVHSLFLKAERELKLEPTLSVSYKCILYVVGR